MNFDGQDLRSSIVIPGSALDVAGIATDYHLLNCDTFLSFNRNFSAITENYQNYYYTQASVEWIPSVSPVGTYAGTQVFLAYLDNPEEILFFIGATNAARIAGISKFPHVKVFNAWERITWNVPLTRRRKQFAVDESSPAYTRELIDSETQGMVICGFIGQAAGFGQVLGSWHLTAVTRLFGLSGFTN